MIWRAERTNRCTACGARTSQGPLAFIRNRRRRRKLRPVSPEIPHSTCRRIVQTNQGKCENSHHISKNLIVKSGCGKLKIPDIVNADYRRPKRYCKRPLFVARTEQLVPNRMV